jgi:two-component system, chemotaxis family, protein-glutamate methylesterase/glutaminase
MTRHRDGPPDGELDQQSPPLPTFSNGCLRRDIVTIGASAGGVEALIQLFEKLPAGMPATIAVVIHRHPTRKSELVKVLDRHSYLPVVEPEDGELIQQSHIYLAPQDHHLLMEPTCFRLHSGPKRHHTRPAVNPLFESAAVAFGPRVVGVLLSGGGDDGVDGLIEISKVGGVSLAQDPGEARNPSMPTQAIREDDVHAVLPLARLAGALMTLATEGTLEQGTPLPQSRHIPLG